MVVDAFKYLFTQLGIACMVSNHRIPFISAWSNTNLMWLFLTNFNTAFKTFIFKFSTTKLNLIFFRGNILF